jgi:hypothetical protein
MENNSHELIRDIVSNLKSGEPNDQSLLEKYQIDAPELAKLKEQIRSIQSNEQIKPTIIDDIKEQIKKGKITDQHLMEKYKINEAVLEEWKRRIGKAKNPIMKFFTNTNLWQYIAFIVLFYFTGAYKIVRPQIIIFTTIISNFPLVFIGVFSTFIETLKNWWKEIKNNYLDYFFALFSLILLILYLLFSYISSDTSKGMNISCKIDAGYYDTFKKDTIDAFKIQKQCELIICSLYLNTFMAKTMVEHSIPFYSENQIKIYKSAFDTTLDDFIYIRFLKDKRGLIFIEPKEKITINCKSQSVMPADSTYKYLIQIPLSAICNDKSKVLKLYFNEKILVAKAEF